MAYCHQAIDVVRGIIPSKKVTAVALIALSCIAAFALSQQVIEISFRDISQTWIPYPSPCNPAELRRGYLPVTGLNYKYEISSGPFALPNEEMELALRGIADMIESYIQNIGYVVGMRLLKTKIHFPFKYPLLHLWNWISAPSECRLPLRKPLQKCIQISIKNCYNLKHWFLKHWSSTIRVEAETYLTRNPNKLYVYKFPDSSMKDSLPSLLEGLRIMKSKLIEHSKLSASQAQHLLKAFMIKIEVPKPEITPLEPHEKEIFAALKKEKGPPAKKPPRKQSVTVRAVREEL